MEAAMTEVRMPSASAPSNPLARLLAGVNRGVMHVVAAVAAALVVVETAVLLAGVIYRYALHDPLIWSDELASTLFIWLSMLGAVLALDRGEHMRLTAIVNRLSDKWRIWFETVAALIVCIFVLMIIHPAVDHASEQMAITTPALEIPDGLRAAALPVGAILMFLAAISRMASRSSVRQVASAVAVVALIGALLWISKPALLAMGNYNLIVFFVLLIGACVAGGIPIAFAFGTATMAYLTIATGAPMMIVVSRMDEGMSSLILLSVPLFVLLGSLLEISGLARTLIDFMAALLGHVRGGLQYVLLGAMFLVSGISGAMTETIPPSLVLITIGAVCSVSITALFIGGLMPAVIATIAIGIICWFRARREPMPDVKRATIGVIGKTLIAAIPALALPMLIRVAVIE